TQALDNLGPAAEKVGAFLGDVLAKAASFITEKVVPAARAGIEAIQLFIGSFTGEGADIGEFLPPDLWDPIINAGAKARQIFDEVAPKIKTAFDTVKQTITDLAPKVLDIVGKLGELGGWVMRNYDWLTSISRVIAAAVAAYMAYVKVQTAVKAITAAVTAVQLALNGALVANPIGIVVAAIAGFVAALVLLYNKNEAFRNLVNTVWAAIKTAIGAVIDWFKKWVVPVATRVFQDIGKVANWLWTNVIRPVAGFIQTAFKAVGNVLKAVWTGFLQPIFKLIGQVFRALFQVHIKVISTAIQVAFKAIGSAMKWVWETLLRPVFNLIKTVFAAVARDLGEKFAKIKAGWRVLSDAMRSVWNKYIKPVFDAVGKVVGGLHEKFKKGVDAIGKAWDLLKDKAKEPVRFVVETVINGLIGKFNDI